jgi:hypothetical protein
VSEQIQPGNAPGWYPDPERPYTQRYWDGDQWTDQRAPVTEKSTPEGSDSSAIDPRLIAGLLFAGLGAILAIIGVFLPEADTETGIHIAKNSLIQHWEGALIVALALVGLTLAVFRSAWGVFIAGGVLVGLAVAAGTDLPIYYRNHFSEVVGRASHPSPGAGIWAVGAGGALLMVSAFFAEWKLPSGGSSGKWQELMAGKRGPSEYVEGNEETAEDRGSR